MEERKSGKRRKIHSSICDRVYRIRRKFVSKAAVYTRPANVLNRMLYALYLVCHLRTLCCYVVVVVEYMRLSTGADSCRGIYVFLAAALTGSLFSLCALRYGYVYGVRSVRTYDDIYYVCMVRVHILRIFALLCICINSRVLKFCFANGCKIRRVLLNHLSLEAACMLFAWLRSYPYNVRGTMRRSCGKLCRIFLFKPIS